MNGRLLDFNILWSSFELLDEMAPYCLRIEYCIIYWLCFHCITIVFMFLFFYFILEWRHLLTINLTWLDLMLIPCDFNYWNICTSPRNNNSVGNRFRKLCFIGTFWFMSTAQSFSPQRLAEIQQDSLNIIDW
jgi:hypothetical protein